MNYSLDERVKQLETLLMNTFDELRQQMEWTDFTYNGSHYYLNSREKGRHMLNCKAVDVENFLRQVANLMGKNYNLTSPILDLSFGHYRLNAMYSSIAKQNNQPCLSFAFRRMSEQLCIRDDDIVVMSKDMREFLTQLLQDKQSILISGRTGTGKTEMQKYLLSKLSSHTRVIMIEDTYETHIKELAPHLDITTWVVPPNSPNLLHTYRELLLAALRNNPDWIVISELRGGEGRAVYEAVLAGHPMITTMHSSDPEINLHRLRQLISDLPSSSDHQMMETLTRLFPYTIHMQDTISPNGSRVYAVDCICHYSFDRRSNRVVTKIIAQHPKDTSV